MRIERITLGLICGFRFEKQVYGGTVLRLYRRHRASCSQTSERYRRCSCPIYVEGSLAGEHIRKALDLNSWEAAEKKIGEWRTAGQIGGSVIQAVGIAKAVEKFLADGVARHLANETLRKYKHLLERRFVPWAEHAGVRYLRNIAVENLREFRASWQDGALYAQKNLERLRAFFRFAEQAGWTRNNPALAVKSPRVRPTQKLPFTEDEMRRILEACDRYRGNAKRMRAFVLLMRYSGLRISDALSMGRERVQNGKLHVATTKTGSEVWLPLPSFVLEALEAVGGQLWTETGGQTKTWRRNMYRCLSTVFADARIEGGHSHRFRHTFSCSLLEKGVPVEIVAKLLGNSVKVVEKHYAAHVKSRQDALEAAVRQTWHEQGAA